MFPALLIYNIVGSQDLQQCIRTYLLSCMMNIKVYVLTANCIFIICIQVLGFFFNSVSKIPVHTLRQTKQFQGK